MNASVRTRVGLRKLAGLLLVALLGTLAAPAAAAPAVTASPLPPWLSAGTTWHNPKAKAPKIVNVRYAQHATFDRVVIDVKGLIPGGHTKYRRVFHYDGSGKRIPIRGGLEVVLRPAYTVNAAGDEVYTGPRLVRPGFPALKAIALAGSFEGQVNLAFGLSPRRTPYRIFLLHGPQRLVVDFKHAT
jgi:hypothetical protein